MTINEQKNDQAPADQKRQWYAIHVFSGAETYVMNALRQRAAQQQMEDCFGEIMVPKEKVVEMRRGQKCTSERKYFPGYVLVHMVMNDDTWHLVKSVPKVLGFIGGKSDKPAPLSAKDVDEIFNRMQAGEDKPKPKIVYEVGEVVRVTNGPFADFNGVVEEVNYEKNRLRVAVLIFGRSTPVELEFNQVEKG